MTFCDSVISSSSDCLVVEKPGKREREGGWEGRFTQSCKKCFYDLILCSPEIELISVEGMTPVISTALVFSSSCISSGVSCAARATPPNELTIASL